MENIVKIGKSRKGKKRLVITNEEFVTCEICGKKMRWIQNRHLETHGTTLKEYREKYPDSPTKTMSMQRKLDDTRARKEEEPFHGRYCAREGCNNPCRTAKKMYCSISCSSKTRMNDPELNVFMKNNPAYKDGNSASNSRAKKARAKYDNYTCKCCGKSELDGKTRRYGVHHILTRALFSINIETMKLRDSKDNLITLCGSCHKKIETRTLYHIFNKVIAGDSFSDLESLITEIRSLIESGFEIKQLELEGVDGFE